MNITVIQLGQSSRTIVAMEGATVSDVLNALNISPEGKTVNVNGGSATLGTTLSDGDEIGLTPKVAGGR